MNLKKMIEENLVLSVLGLLAVGFAAGWGADYIIRGELINLRVQLLTEKVSTLQKEIEKKDNFITQKTNEVETLTKKSKESERRETDYQATAKALEKRLTEKDGEAAAQKEKHEAEIKKHQERHFSLEQNVKTQSEEITRLKKDLQEASSKAASASKESSSTTTVNVKDSPGSTSVGVGSGGQVNIQNQPRLPELSEDIVSIVIKSVFSDYKDIHVCACKVVRSDQFKPLMFIVYDRVDARYFTAIQNDNEKWKTVWNFRDDSRVFLVSGGEISYDEDKWLLTFQGCFPHNCDSSWGFLIYDIKHETGWAVRRLNESDGKKERIHVDFPLKMPSNLWQLRKFEEKLIADIRNIDVLQYLPATRIIPPFYEDEEEMSESVREEIRKALPKKSNLKIRRVFFTDAGGNGTLDAIVCVDEPKITAYVVRKGLPTQELPYSIDQDVPQFVARYDVLRESPYLFLGGHGGSGGYPYGDVYRWDGSRYKLISEMKKVLMKEFAIEKPGPPAISHIHR